MRNFNFLTILLLSSFRLFAQFDEPIEFNSWTGDPVSKIHVADFDQDGETEIIGINSARAFSIVESGQSEILFSLPQGREYRASDVLDLNQDGDLEIVIMTSQNNSLFANIYELENGSWSSSLIESIGITQQPFFPTEIFTAELNSFGPVVVYSTSVDIGMIVYENGSFNTRILENTTIQPFQVPLVSLVQIMDYDLDGKNDLVWFFQDGFFTFEIFVRLSNGTSFSERVDLKFDAPNTSFIPSTPIFNGPNFPMDVDNDGDLDFVVSSYDTQTIHWIENIENGLLALPRLLGVNFSFNEEEFLPNVLEKFDVDGDGFEDFVTGTSTGIRFHRNRGDATFEEIVLFENPSIALTIGQIDDDEIPDIAFSSPTEGFQNDAFVSFGNNDQILSTFFENSDDICAGQKTFRNNSTCHFPSSTIEWDFGNGEISNDIHPSTSYDEPGEYEVSLTVCNESICDTSFQNVALVEADVMLPDTIQLGIPYQFTDNTLFIENRTWSFGDGVTSSEASFLHSYSFPGIYLVELFLNTSDPAVCQFVIKKEIVVPPILDDSDGLIIFPNPMTESCQLIFDNPENRNFRIQIFNNLGQEIFDDQRADSFFYTFDNELLIEGVYHIHLTQNGVFVDTKKLIVVEP